VRTPAFYARYVPVCGTCGADNPAGKRFCGDCGSVLASGCPACGAENPPGKKFCGDCGASLAEVVAAQPAAPAASESPVAERRLVSVLFADLVGFTPLSESRDAEEVRALLSRYFDTSRRLIELYGGTVEKFIGDAVMAVWGTPTATEDDAERAVRAAMDLVAAVSALGQEVGAEELRARAGVLTGEAAVTIGAQGEGMVAGDVVNTASRVQSVAEPGTVLVGEATRRASEQAIVYDDAGTFELKGKEEEARLWKALRVVSGVGGQLKSQGLEAPFVGRDRELRQIKDLFHISAEERRAQLISISGIAGIGKSRLAWEFYKYIDGLADNTYWHRGRCLSYGEGVTYWALADMVRMRCRIAEDEQPTAALEKLRVALEEHLLDAEERAFVEPRLAQLLGLGDQETGERQDLFAAWRLFFERLSDVYPTVLSFEDMQWADASLLDFVEYLLEWSRNHPLFVVTLARPELAERRPTWGAGHRNFTSLYLEPLSGQAMEELLAGLVPGLPESVRDQILARAEGVPLYAVETVRMLLDRGLLVEEGAAYRVAGEVGSLEVPETLHALVAARLDGLAPEERRLVGDASVLGKTFTKNALAALSGVDPGGLEELLQGLVRREVLGVQSDPRSPEHGQYGFLQDLLRQVAYETLPKQERRAMHLAAAEYLSTSLVEEEVVEVVASHLLDAYRLDPEDLEAETLRVKAHSALARAGERSASLGALGEAMRYFEQAAELAGAPEEQAAALLRGAQMALRDGKAKHASSLLETAVALFESVADTHATARASSWLAHAEMRLGKIQEAIALLERTYGIVADDEPDADLALLFNRLATAHTWAGNVDEAARWNERALDVAEALQLTEELVRGWNTRAILLSSRRPEEARALRQLGLDLALEHQLHNVAGSIYGNLSDAAFRHDRYGESLAILEQQLALGRRFGERAVEWFALSEMTYALTMLGRWEEASARFGELPDEQVGSNPSLVSPLSGVLEIHIRQGKLDAARQLLARFDRLSGSGDLQAEGCYHAATAAIRLAEGNAREAMSAAERALEGRATHGLGSQDVKLGYLHALEAALALGEGDRAQELLAAIEEEPIGLRPPFLDACAHRFRARLAGEAPTADGHYTAGAAQLRALELPFHLAVVLLEHGEWLVAQGRDADAEPFVAEAREIFERLEATVWLDRLEELQAGAASQIPA
jgi:predicted ATPase/class 3 adenylate cyclase